MGRAFDVITDQMRDFVADQHVFFVATAPSEGGHVNLSPKGYDSFRVLAPDRVAYLDLTGSGAETIAHVRDNGRVTFMFCAFSGKPNIVRVQGQGRVVLPDDAEFADLIAQFPPRRGVRSIIVVDVDRTSTSCGYSVPFMSYDGERERLDEWVAGRTDDEIAEYWATTNVTSIDGLPAIDAQS